MADIVLKDRQGVPQTYAGYAKVAFNTPDSGTVIFSEGEATENVPIDLNLADGDQTVEAESGTLIKSAIIKKPATLTPENVAKDVNVAGVVGTFIGNGLENVEIIPDFSEGDQTVTAEADTFIKSAIVRKPETLVPENIAKGVEVAGVTGSLSGAMGDYIRFFDFDCTLVDGWSKAKLESATELPAYPEHEGLTCQGWNWTLDQLKAENAPMDVGAMYITSDRKTRIYITLSEGRTSPCLGLAVNGSVDVDWGDGTEHDTLTGISITSVKYTQNHAYAAAGDYVITLTITGSANVIGTSNYSYLLTNSSSPSNASIAYANSIKRVRLGENIALYNYAFSSCYSLAKITIPASVTSIGSYAFSGCYSLAQITIPSGVTSIGSYAFQNCCSLAQITIPSGVTSIDSYAFQNCYSLAQITIPSGVTSISSSAFSSCCSLAQITIPSGVTSIGSSAFSSCYSLAQITIPASVTSISNYAFESCRSLAQITIPSGVTSISSSAFSGCYSLAQITIPSGVTSISNYAFESCRSLAQITIPASVTSIGSYAFSGCYSLAQITIPSGVTSISSSAFSSCRSLAQITFESDTPPTVSSSNAFNSLPTDCVIYVPNDSYLTATNYPSPDKYTYVVGGAA